ncbi:uncharacterized protein LOC111025302 [Momordica charantia]|uniref:Uncharacterized protein LOC111025302 n=1 Tax=Momordica charantia TaxID=3673 RepID=A0A6J1E251_MOMCH|nr:uncharacterized protein LOC111025302 [Momordica charantia]
MNRNAQDPPPPQNPPVNGDMAGEEAANRVGEIPNLILLADNRDVAMRNYVTHAFHNLNSGINNPLPQAAQFELKPVMFQILQTMGQFGGLTNEDPYSHLKSFIEIANAFQLPGNSEDALRLKMFPFSLRDGARTWINALEPNSINTWAELTDKFLAKYHTLTKNADLREDIVSFRQKENEAVQEAWERFKELLRRCPSHGLPSCVQIEQFYRGLDRSSKMMLNTLANGSLLEKSVNEIVDVLNKMTDINDQGEMGRSLPKKQVSTGIFELDTVASMQAQMAAMNQMLKQLTMEKETKTVTSAIPEHSPILQISDISCVYCGQGAQRNFNPYSNTYNPGWRHHPNFSWSNQGVASSSAQAPAQQYK